MRAGCNRYAILDPIVLNVRKADVKCEPLYGRDLPPVLDEYDDKEIAS